MTILRILRPWQTQASFLKIFVRHSITDVAADAASVRPASEIPGPKNLPLIGTMYKFLPGGEYYNIKNFDDIARMKYKKYGSIVRQEYIPGMFITSLFEPSDFEKVYKKEGDERLRPQFDFVKLYFESRKREPSLTARQGQEWKAARSIIQKPMMRPRSIAAYLPKQVLITDDLVEYLREIRDPLTLEVNDCLSQFRKWSLEAVGVVCYSRRLGVLKANPDEDMKEFIYSCCNMVDSIAELVQGFPYYKYFKTKALKRYFEIFDVVYRESEKYIKEVLENQSDYETDENILVQMIKNTDGSDKQIQTVISLSLSVLVAGTDSTAISLTKCLYLLAKHPEVQEKLYKEICEKSPIGSEVTSDTLNSLSYLRAVVKETHRVLGAVSTGTRTLEEDIVIQGYRIPAKEMILLEHRVANEQEKNWKEADRFKAERHLRDNPESKEAHPFSLLPFGFGPRMCIGKRLADQELYLGLLKVIQAFRVEYQHEGIKEISRAFVVPDRPVHLRFIDR